MVFSPPSHLRIGAGHFPALLLAIPPIVTHFLFIAIGESLGLKAEKMHQGQSLRMDWEASTMGAKRLD